MDTLKRKFNTLTTNTRLDAIKALENRSRDDKATLLSAVETQRNSRLVKDLIIHVVFFAIFVIIIVLQLNPSALYNINTSLKNQLLFNSDTPYMNIQFPSDYTNYLSNVFVPTISEMTLENNEAMNKVIGNVIRIRTMRVRPDSCTNNGYNLTCYSNSYTKYTKDREPYGTDNMYTYTPNSHGSFVFGHNNYIWDRSGFYVDIPINENFTNSINSLITNGFFDVQTRAVIISFSSLNLNLQSRTSVVTMLTEWTGSGQINPFYSIRTYRVQIYMDGLDRFRAFLEVSFFIFILYYIYFFINEARIDYKLGRLKYYLLSFKNFFDLINLTLFITSIALYLAFLGDRSRVLALDDQVQYSTDYPTYLENLGQTALVLYQISAINILLMSFKTFRFLIVHRRLYILWIAISQSKLQLITFTVMFCIMMLGFLFSGWLSFGTDNQSFNGFVTSLGTLLQFIIGNPPDYEAMSNTNRALGPIYYLLFTIFMFFILVNMFVAIISNSYQNISNTFDKKQKNKRYLMTKWERTKKSLELLFRPGTIDIYDLVILIIDQRPGLIETDGIEPSRFRDELLVLLPKIKNDESYYYSDLLMKVQRCRAKYLEQMHSVKNTGISFELKLMGQKDIIKKDFDAWKKNAKKSEKKKFQVLQSHIDSLNLKLDLIINAMNLQNNLQNIQQQQQNVMAASSSSFAPTTSQIQTSINNSINNNINNNNNNNLSNSTGSSSSNNGQINLSGSFQP